MDVDGSDDEVLSTFGLKKFVDKGVEPNIATALLRYNLALNAPPRSDTSECESLVGAPLVGAGGLLCLAPGGLLGFRTSVIRARYISI